MSSSCHLSVPEHHGLNRRTWETFAEENSIVYSPKTIGGDTWYLGEVEVVFKRRMDDWALTIGTFHMGRAIPEVARLAVKCWQHFGGSLEADPEVLAYIISGKALPAQY